MTRAKGWSHTGTAERTRPNWVNQFNRRSTARPVGATRESSLPAGYRAVGCDILVGSSDGPRSPQAALGLRTRCLIAGACITNGGGDGSERAALEYPVTHLVRKRICSSHRCVQTDLLGQRHLAVLIGMCTVESSEPHVSRCSLYWGERLSKVTSPQPRRKRSRLK
jgi:hypothetical protein